MFLAGQIDYKLILKSVDQIQLLRNYNIEVNLAKSVRNPLRHDNKPGCKFAYDKDGILVLFDYAKGKSYTVIDILCEKLSISFAQAINLIATSNLKPRTIVIHREEETKYKDILYRETRISKIDLKYFNVPLNFIKEHLKKVDFVKFGETLIEDKNMFLFEVEKEKVYQIYRPTLAKEFRYRSNKNKGLYGTVTNPEKPYIITKSFRDHLILKHLGYSNVLYTLFESYKITEQDLEDKKITKDSHIITLYDNDTTGIEKSQKFKNDFTDYKIINIYYPKEWGKDSQDVVQIKNKKEIIKYINNGYRSNL